MLAAQIATTVRPSLRNLTCCDRIVCFGLLDIAAEQSQVKVWRRVLSTSAAEESTVEEGPAPQRYYRADRPKGKSPPLHKKRDGLGWRPAGGSPRGRPAVRPPPQAGHVAESSTNEAFDTSAASGASAVPAGALNGPALVRRETVAAQRNCQELWRFAKACSVPQLTLRALSGVMDRCARLFLQQRASSAQGPEAEACQQLLDAAVPELHRLDAWGLTSFIRLAAAVKYLPSEHLVSWRICVLARVGELTPQGVSNCLLSLGTLLTDAAPPPALAGPEVSTFSSFPAFRREQSRAGGAGASLWEGKTPGMPMAAQPFLPPSQQEQRRQQTDVRPTSAASEAAAEAGPPPGSVAAMASAAAKMLSSSAARAAMHDAHHAGPPLASVVAAAAGAVGGPWSPRDAQQQRGQQQGQQQGQQRGKASLRGPGLYELVGALVRRALELTPALDPQCLANTTYGIATLGWPLTEDETEWLLAQVEQKVPAFNHLEASQLVQAWAKIEDRTLITRGFTAGTRRARASGGFGAAGALAERDADGAGSSDGARGGSRDPLDGCMVAADEGLAEEEASGSGNDMGSSSDEDERGGLGEFEEEWASSSSGSGSDSDSDAGSAASGSGGEEGSGGRSWQRHWRRWQQERRQLELGGGDGGLGNGGAEPFFEDGQGELGVPASPNLFGKLLPANPGVKYVSCYPGLAVMDALIERVYAQRAQMTNQSLSQFLHALGRLRHKPPPALMEGFLTQVEEFLGSNGADACLAATTTLLGCAKLAVVPPDRFIAACLRVAQRGQQSHVREVYTMAWSLATLRVCNKERWELLITAMHSQMGPQVRLSTASNIVLFHAYVLAKLSNPPGAIKLPPSLADPARRMYLYERRTRRPSKTSNFAAGVLRELRNMGYSARLEYPIGQGVIFVDILVPELNLVIECDGPWHFIRNTEEYTGGTLCRNWLIQRLGYRLICVGHPFWQHLANRDVPERSYLLRRFFREFHGLYPAWEGGFRGGDSGSQGRAAS